jgi:predicted permease
MATTTMDYPAPRAARVGLGRAMTVAAATVAAIAVWAIAVPLLGAHLLIRFGSGAPESIGVDYILGATVITSLIGWGVLALLERRTPRARTIWTALAIVVVLVSLGLPLTAGTTTSTKVVLALMHVAVASVLILGLPRGGMAQNRP